MSEANLIRCSYCGGWHENNKCPKILDEYHQEEMKREEEKRLWSQYAREEQEREERERSGK